MEKLWIKQKHWWRRRAAERRGTIDERRRGCVFLNPDFMGEMNKWSPNIDSLKWRSYPYLLPANWADELSLSMQARSPYVYHV